jgi:hypothetical protein
VDLVEPPEIPHGCEFIKQDVLDIWATGGWVHMDNEFACIWSQEFDFICASSPCERFSTILNFRQPVPYPESGVKLFNHTRGICEASRLPYVIENVAGAMRFVGKAVNHCGPFYLWGNAVPPILPQGIRKGLGILAMGCRETKGKPGWNDRGTTQLGKNDTAKVATIPPELANCVADYAERLLEAK